MDSRQPLKCTGTYGETRERERKGKYKKLKDRREDELEKSRNSLSYDNTKTICLNCFLHCVSFIGDFKTYLNFRLTCKGLNEILTSETFIRSSCNVSTVQPIWKFNEGFDSGVYGSIVWNSSKSKEEEATFERTVKPEITRLRLKDKLTDGRSWWSMFHPDIRKISNSRIESITNSANENLHVRIFKTFPNLKFLNIHVRMAGLFETILKHKKVPSFTLRVREIELISAFDKVRKEWPSVKRYNENFLKFLDQGNVLFAERGWNSYSKDYYEETYDEYIPLPKELENYVQYGIVLEVKGSNWDNKHVDQKFILKGKAYRRNDPELFKVIDKKAQLPISDGKYVFGKFLLANRRCKQFELVFRDGK